MPDEVSNHEVTVIELKAVVTAFDSMLKNLNEMQQSLNNAVKAMDNAAKASTNINKGNAAIATSSKSAASSIKEETQAVVAQSKAMEAGSAAERRMAEQAKKSFEIWRQAADQRANATKNVENGFTGSTGRGFRKLYSEILPTEANTSFAQAIKNIRQYNAAVKGLVVDNKNLISGIATNTSIKQMTAGGALQFEQALKPMDQFRLKMDNLGTVTKEWSQHLQNLGKQMQWTGRQMIVGLTLPIALGAQKAISAFTSVNSEFTNLSRILNVPQSSKAIQGLQKEAEQTSNRFHIMLRDVGSVFADIAAWGIPTDKIQAFSDQVLRLTKLDNQMNVSQAEDFFRVVNSIFSQQSHMDNSGKIVAGITDLGAQLNNTKNLMNAFVGVADKTQIKLSDLSAGFPQVANSAKLFGFSAADTAAALAGMYQSGIDASEGANGLRFVMTRILDPTTAASKTFDGFAKAVGSTFTVEQIARMKTGKEKLAAIDEVLKKLGPSQQTALLGDLGGRRQIEKLLVLMHQFGDGVPQINKALLAMSKGANFDDATRGMNDFAKAEVEATLSNKELRQQAEKKLNIVLGSPEEQFKEVQVKFQTMLYKLGKDILPIVTKIGGAIVNVLDKIMNMPGPFKGLILGGLAFLAALGPINFMIGQMGLILGSVGIFVGKIIPSLKTFDSAFDLSGKRVAQVGEQLKLLDRQNPIKKIFGAFKDAANPVISKLADIDKSIITQTSLVDAQVVAVDKVAKAWDNVGKSQQLSMIEQAGTANLKGGKFRGPDGKFTTMGAENALNFNKRKPVYGPPSPKELQLPLFSGGGGGRQGNVLDDVGKGTEKVAAGAAKAESKLKMMKNLIQNLIPIGLGFFKTFTMFTIIGTVIAVIVIGIVAFMKHWKEVSANMKPGLDAIREGWKAISNALDKVVKVAKKAFSSVVGKDQKGGGKDNFWGQIGQVLGLVGKLLGLIMKLAAKVIDFLQPLFKMWGALIGEAVRFFGFFTKALSELAKNGLSDKFFNFLGKALQSLARYGVQLFTPLWWVVDTIVKAALWAFEKVLAVARVAASAIDDVFGSNLEDPVKNAQKTIDKLSHSFNSKDLLLKLIGDPGQLLGKTKKASKETTDKLKDQTTATGELANANDALSASLDELIAALQKQKDALQEQLSKLTEFLGALKTALDAQVNTIKDDLLNALQAKFDAQMKVYDDQLKAMDDQEKAEARLTATIEYETKRREMIANHAIDGDNYRRNRALAIYEGRIDDARMLDLDFKKTTDGYNSDLGNLDKDRAKEILDQKRADARDSIQILKDQLAAQQKLEEDAFKKRLDEITKFTPKNVAEVQNMFDQLKALGADYGLSAELVFKSMAQTPTEFFNKAIVDAQAQLSDAFYWAGNTAASNFLLGFNDMAKSGIAKTIDDLDAQIKALQDQKKGLDAGSGDIGSDTGSDGIQLPLSGSKKGAKNPISDKKLFGPIKSDSKKQGKEAGTSFIDGIWDGFLDGLAGGNLKGILDTISGAFNGIIDFVKGIFGISSPSTVFFAIGGDIIQGLIDGLTSFVTGVITFFTNLPSMIMTAIGDISSTFINLGTSFITWLVQGISTAAVNIFNFFTSLPEKIFDFFVKGATFFEKIGSFIFNAIGSGIASVIGTIWGWFGKIVPEGFIGTVKNIAETIINTLIGGVNGLFHLINKAIGAVWDIPGLGDVLGWIAGDAPHIPDIPKVHFHTGGFVNGVGDVPATLQAGEFVLKKSTVDKLGKGALNNLNNMKFSAPSSAGVAIPRFTGQDNKSAAGSGSSGGDTYISVDTFIGQKEWFDDMMKTHKVKTKPKTNRRNGTLNRKVGSYQDNLVRYD